MSGIAGLFSLPTVRWFEAAFGAPTRVQEEAWPAIIEEKPVLVSAPTGTGKTLSAFLVFIDRLKSLARAGELEGKLYVIYISPLKSLAGDIRENLKRPLDGISAVEEQLYGKATEINVAVRTGDTPQRDRQRMIKHPPHILIITPESLYLMLTSKNGRLILGSAEAIIIDELHAMIDTKRGAHLMLSIARLDDLCRRPVQRIGLSATIEPLTLAAEYLAPEPAVIIAPRMEKKIRIEVKGTLPRIGRRKDPVWEELGKVIYEQCQGSKSVIAFSEGRRNAEKIAFYVNELAGDGFARVHHGSISKEQRLETERALRDGTLRLLCATSSMELGIDVGEIDQVLQVGCPRSISSTMQRLGRAGHNPGRVSFMYMYPRTAPEGLRCGMTAETARQGSVEKAAPPRMCLDVLAQHLVSMTVIPYTVAEVMSILARTYSFRDVSKADVEDVLRMLAGDYEHRREIPVRPRVLYDRIHNRVTGDAYSRMLAVAAGGTIPDKGLFHMKTEDGVRLGELDEEFVYECRIGDRIMLGSFAWRILKQDRDSVFVAPAAAEGARLPFWKSDYRGSSLETSLAFARMLRNFNAGLEAGTIRADLMKLGMNESAAESGADFLQRQLESTGILPDDRTIIAEHFTDHTGCHQIMIHAWFGRRVNSPLALLLQHTVMKMLHVNTGCVDEEDGLLLYPYGSEVLPEGLLYAVSPHSARQILEAMLPLTPVFSMTFRYNAARALMMGMKSQGRQPLWLQRLKSTEMMDFLKEEKKHPLIRETRRECLEEIWDIDGLVGILNEIQSGAIAVREVYTEIPSPMSLPLQWQVEAEEMYSYTPATEGLRQSVYAELDAISKLKPAAEELLKQQERKKRPENADQLHSLLMIEGDLLAEELAELDEPLRGDELKLPAAGNTRIMTWMEELLSRELVMYVEPGLWIAAEQQEEYEKALITGDKEALLPVVRRMLFYRGAMKLEQITERYFLAERLAAEIIRELCGLDDVIEDEGIYYHAKLYSRARKATIRNLRSQTATQPAEAYACLMAGSAERNAAPEEQLAMAVKQYCGEPFPAILWETVILPRRVRGYRENMLDRLLAGGEYFWRFSAGGNISFERSEEIDWEQEPGESVASGVNDGMNVNREMKETGVGSEHPADEELLYSELRRRGASFMRAFNNLPLRGNLVDGLLALAERGHVCADSFLPVRQWLNQEKIKKASPRSRVNARVMALSTGRWDVIRPLRERKMEDWLEQLLSRHVILCRETYRRPDTMAAETAAKDQAEGSWSRALEILRVWEYTGRVRRGYYVAGMSGAQFVRAREHEGIIMALQRYAGRGIGAAPGGDKDGDADRERTYGEEGEIIWLNATDPCQIWGKALAMKEGKPFMNVPGTLVGLWGGAPAAVLERQGKTLRFLVEEKMLTEEKMLALMKELVFMYQQGRVLVNKKRLVIKEYPDKAVGVLEAVGFRKEMLDYVLYYQGR